jgi:hypothetical protein
VFILGLILILLGWLLGVSVLYTMGIILVVVGAVLLLIGGLGTPVFGRRYWF